MVNFQSVIGNNSNSNTLIGPSSDAIWEITGANSGTILLSGNSTALPITFAGFANLTGPVGTSDGFITGGGGSISGTITGGAGGVNALAIEDPINLGTLALVKFGTAGTAGPNSGTMSPSQVYASASSISFSFAGIDNPIYQDTSVPNVFTLGGGVLDENLTLTQSQTNSQQYTLSDSNTVWNYSSLATPVSGDSLTVTRSSSRYPELRGLPATPPPPSARSIRAAAI